MFHAENLVSPRELALAGSITAIAEGFESAGINPARFAFSKSSHNLFHLSNSINNSLISLKIYNQYNNIDMTGKNAHKKLELIDYIGNRLLNLSANVNLNIPLLNFNNHRYAIHSRLTEFIESEIGNDLVLLAFMGNDFEKEISPERDFKSRLIGEYGISWWTKNSPIAFGTTIKYLQGISFLHYYSDESLFTDMSGVNYSGIYRLDQYPGGSGFAMDFGLAVEDIKAGWSLGISAINLFGFLKWDTHNLTQSLMGDAVSEMLPLDGYQSKITQFNLLNLTADNFLSGGEGIPDTVVSQDTALVTLDQSPLKMDYPAMFRIGSTKMFGSNYLISFDIRTGFKNGESITKNWISSIGIEITRFSIFPIRIGISNGSLNDKRLGLGFGLRLKPIHFDFGLAWTGSRKLYSATGLEFGISLNLVR